MAQAPGPLPRGLARRAGRECRSRRRDGAFERELDDEQGAEREAAERKLTVRQIATEWLEWLSEVRGAKPSTVQDYEFLLRDPGIPYKRGAKVTAGRIMTAFGNQRYDQVTAAAVSKFLRTLDREGLTPRNVNKHRQVLAAIFGYACRADTYGLTVNPVAGTDKRREDPPAALDYYEVHEVEALARCCEQGSHHTRPPAQDPGEIKARWWEDHRDADLFRVLFYTGLRLGEALALRIGSVDLEARLLLVRAGVSAGQESAPKGRRHRFVPLSTPAQQALARLLNRHEFTSLDDYVIVNRLGRRLDASAVRRRYKNAFAQAGLRPVRLHGLRHAAGSLVARTNDPVFVRDFLGHSKLATTDATSAPSCGPRSSSGSTARSGSSPRTQRRGQGRLNDPVQRRRHRACGLRQLLDDIKARIRSARVAATLAVNQALIGLYWEIGNEIVMRNRAEGWGEGDRPAGC